jgi:hypothetical protein
MLKQYSLSKGLVKGLYVAGAVATGILSAVQSVNGEQGIRSITAAVAFSTIIGGIRVATNWWKINYRE